MGYGASRFFRALNAFEMFWHAEGMKTAFEGWVRLNGEEYRVHPETCYGYADKNWGGDFASPWVWLSSSDLVSRRTGKRLQNSVFEVDGGRPKVFGFALNRKLLGQFYYEGRDYEFNFSKFWTGSRTFFDCTETDTQILWKVTQTTFRTKWKRKSRAIRRRCCSSTTNLPTGSSVIPAFGIAETGLVPYGCMKSIGAAGTSLTTWKPEVSDASTRSTAHNGAVSSVLSNTPPQRFVLRRCVA